MRLRVALAILLGLMTLPASAGAYVIGGRPWPGHRIAYFNADKQMARAVALAVHAWNTSGAHVRLVAAPRGAKRHQPAHGANPVASWRAAGGPQQAAAARALRREQGQLPEHGRDRHAGGPARFDLAGARSDGVAHLTVPSAPEPRHLL